MILKVNMVTLDLINLNCPIDNVGNGELLSTVGGCSGLDFGRVGCDVESEGPSKILELPTISHPVEVVSCDESADSDSSVPDYKRSSKKI